MIIKSNKPFNGIYNGEDVEKELELYMLQLMDYTDGIPYVKETRKRTRIEIPEGSRS